MSTIHQMKRQRLREIECISKAIGNWVVNKELNLVSLNLPLSHWYLAGQATSCDWESNGDEKVNELLLVALIRQVLKKINIYG